jgi:hypothetical protein
MSSTEPSNFEQFLKDLKPSSTYQIIVNGEIISWVHKHSCESHLKIKIRDIAKSHANCTCCTNNVVNLFPLSGPDGSLLFQGAKFPTLISQINELHKLSEEVQKSDYKCTLVTTKTFPPSKKTGPRGQSEKEWFHITVKPDNVTSEQMTCRLEPFWDKVNNSVLPRLSKFLSKEARESMNIIKRIITTGKLERPEYWKRSCEWILNLLDKFPQQNFEVMTNVDKEALAIYAMATGTASQDVHFEFQTAENLIDFMSMKTEEDITKAMDSRSDPRTNQISQLARAKAQNNVTCESGVALLWDGTKYKDDLDLSVRIGRDTCNFVKKTIEFCQLDFDAGVYGKEAEPVEHISFNESGYNIYFDVYVNLYTRRTFNKDIPFTIIITQIGKPDIVHELVWPKDRQTHNFMHICNHIFTPVELPELEVSESKARALKAQELEFEQLFGKPTTTIATLDDLIKMKCVVYNINSRTKSDETKKAFNEFSNIINKPKHAMPNQRKYISDYLKGHPTHIEDLCKLIQENSEKHTIQVHIRDQSPGYITYVNVGSNGALKTGNSCLGLCHYQEHGKQPLIPTKSGDARLDETWFTQIEKYNGLELSNVIAIVKIKEIYFLVLENAKLSNNTACFPLIAGFYHEQLNIDAYNHRSKWQFLNNALPLQMPMESDSPVAIGTFLMGDTTTLYLNGKKLILKI